MQYVGAAEAARRLGISARHAPPLGPRRPHRGGARPGRTAASSRCRRSSASRPRDAHALSAPQPLPRGRGPLSRSRVSWHRSRSTSRSRHASSPVITRDAAEALGLAPGDDATGGREGDIRDGRAVKLLALTLLAAAHLNVFGAASLADVLPRFDRAARYQFGGSDQLGVPGPRRARRPTSSSPRSPKYPQELFAARLCSRPVAFATNTVVLIVPRANPARIRSVLRSRPRRHPARRRREGRPDRRLHAQAARQPRAVVGCSGTS